MKNITDIDMPISGNSVDPVSAVLRLFRIMRLMGERKVSDPTELSRRAMMPRQAVHRMLQTMLALGYATQGRRGEGYRLSLRLFELGARALEFKELGECAYPHMHELGTRLRETIQLGVLVDGHHIHCRLGIEAGHGLYVSARTGRHLPLHGSAMGKVLVAWLGEAERRQVLKAVAFVPFTRHTIRDVDTLLDELVRIRGQGYAEDDEEVEPGLRSVAVPVYDRLGHVIAALSLSLPKVRFRDDSRDALLLPLQEVAEAISREMGLPDYARQPRKEEPRGESMGRGLII